MQNIDEDAYLYEEFVVFNLDLGLRSFTPLGDIEEAEGIFRKAWLEEPYEFVGPFNLDELLTTGKIEFEQCVVMSQDRWLREKDVLAKLSYEKQQKFHEKFQKSVHDFNNKRKIGSEKEHRELLNLPIHGELEITQIKTAYKKIVKKVHPDVGGSHEAFIEITLAKDTLIQKYTSL